MQNDRKIFVRAQYSVTLHNDREVCVRAQAQHEMNVTRAVAPTTRLVRRH
jgi:hypothetical protein